MKKILLSALLFWLICLIFSCSVPAGFKVFIGYIWPSSSALAEGNTEALDIITIWDDVDNLDGSRPETIISDPIPGYTTEQIVRGNQIIFIHHHRPEVSRRSVSNEMLYATLRITVTVDDPGPDEKFAIHLNLSSTDSYTCVIGETTISVSDGSVILLSSGQSAHITLPVGTAWSTEQEEKVRYETTVNGQPGYISSGVMQPEGTDVIYHNTPKLTSFTALKRWDGAVGDRIKLHLFANGKAIECGFYQVNQRYIADRLPIYDYNGKKIVYTAKEEYMEGYLTAYVNYGDHAGETEVLYNGGTIINREVAEFIVYKQWIGVDSSNAPEIRLKLYDGDKEMPFSPIRINKSPGYDMYVWKLPIAYNTHIPSYYVIEEQMNGCYAEYIGEKTDRALNGDTIRNTVIPPTGDRDSIVPWLICLILAGAILMGARRR